MKLKYHRHDLALAKMYVHPRSTNAGNELLEKETPFSGCRISDLEGNRSNISHVKRELGLNGE